MNFISSPKSSVVRIGQLSLHPQFPKCETPACFQYTRIGCIPHVCWDLLPHVQDDDVPILTSIATVIPLQQQLRSLDTNLHQFCRLPQRPVFLSNYDSTAAIKPGANNKAGIAFCRKSGISHISSTAYLDLVSCIKPQAFQSLCDSDTPKDAPNKRIGHAVKRSLQYLDDLYLRQENGPTIATAPVFGSVVGGFDLKSRLISVEDVSGRKVEGFVLEGFHDYDPNNSLILHPEAYDILTQVMDHLPKDAPKALFGCLTPETMFQLMRMGVDIFDSSYATMLTEKGQALLIRISDAADSSISVQSELLDLNKDEFKADMTVIASDCDCYSCKKSFTRAYINHLLVTHEMLSSVLLNLHNIYTLYKFFRNVRHHYS